MCMAFYVSFIWLHVYAFAILPMVHCGSAFEPGASGLPYYCTSTCAHSGCTWRASCVDSQPKIKKNIDPGSYTCVLSKSRTWQVKKLTSCACQVDLSPSPPVPLQINWQVTACQANLSSQLERWPPSNHIRKLSHEKNPRRGVARNDQKKVKIDHFFYFCDQNFSVKMMFLELFCDVLHHERPHCDLAVLLRRWWALRINSTLVTYTNTLKSKTRTNRHMGGFLSWPPFRGVR